MVNDFETVRLKEKLLDHMIHLDNFIEVCQRKANNDIELMQPLEETFQEVFETAQYLQKKIEHDLNAVKNLKSIDSANQKLLDFFEDNYLVTEMGKPERVKPKHILRVADDEVKHAWLDVYDSLLLVNGIGTKQAETVVGRMQIFSMKDYDRGSA